ncbi:winged helix-turn-helix transcriptional regulator [Acetobacteraceae bacterium]|nr:winged helix-turn-helix transcriptional regulator [Candidatus Parcubacteria bacterium]
MKNKEKEMERVLKALANHRRLAILAFLKKKGEGSVGEIGEEIRLSFRATSRHLSVLYAANVLERQQRSLQVFYKISKESSPTLRALFSLL